MIKITVPASSANLGAGFDALGLALTLYNTVWMEEADGCVIESVDGSVIPTDESNMIYHTAKGLYERCGHPFRGLHILQENHIPMTRGLGSSSACLVAGLLGANTLMGSPLSKGDLLDVGGRRYLMRRAEVVYDSKGPLYRWGLCVERGREDAWSDLN